jgi:cellulose synthase/poly-beta-1,6-N-acetylglucosamine synthase-like glycosyltransferase
MVVSLALTLAAMLLYVPALVFALEVSFAVKAAPPRPPTSRRPRLAVLVPAHNEAAGVASTIATVVSQLANGDRLLVVADNCADDTAAVAHKAGAEVIERYDQARRGKGYALDFGVQHLRLAPPEVLIVVDADCVVHPGCIDQLATHCLLINRPVQSLYLMLASGRTLVERWSEFAWRLKNHCRPLGLARGEGPCHLMGSGMAFPWHLISAPSMLSTGHLVEDMVLGVELAKLGCAAQFAPHALVTSTFSHPGAALRSQRTRWEHGHLAVLLRSAPGLLWAGLRRRDGNAIMLALDLMVPPLSLLAMLLVALLLANLAVGSILGGGWLGAQVSGAALGLVFAAVLCAWLRFGRDIIAPHELVLAPLQVLRKLPIYLTFLWRRQTEWVRARREGD